jgi:hypothetical protein
MYFEKIVDVQTGEETERELSQDEVLELEKEQANSLKNGEALIKEQQTRLAILASIGLTEEQIQALIG